MSKFKSLNLVASVIVVGALASFIVFSIIADGASAVTLSAHDDGAWLLDQASGTASHVSGAGQEIDSDPLNVGRPSSGNGLQLFQHATVTVVLDVSDGQIKVIDPALREVVGFTEVEEGVVPLAAAKGVYLLRPDGRIRFQPIGAGIPRKLTDADWSPGPGPSLIGATAIDGTVWLYSRETGALWYYGDAGVEQFEINPIDGATLTIVGSTPVLLSGDHSELIIAGDTERHFNVGLSEGALLQLPSVETTVSGVPEVLVADGADVKAISMIDGSTTNRLVDVGDDLAAPAVFGDCVHAFSQQSGRWQRTCGNGEVSERVLVPGAARFRLVNDRLWLDSLRGSADYFLSNDYEPVLVAPDDVDSTSDEANLPPDESSTDSSPSAETGGGAEAAFGLAQVIDGTAIPDADDDEFGSRGEAVTLPVLHNDSDADLDPLVVTDVTYDGSAGTFQIAPGGLAVTFTPDDGFTGSTIASYTISDGRGHDSKAAKIELVKRGETDNMPPTAENDVGRIEADKSIEVAVLSNDWDYDGDSIEIDPESLYSTGGAVSMSERGALRFDAPDEAGTYQVTYTIVDSRETRSEPATLEIIVTEKGARIPPLALPDVVYVRAGTPTTVRPLANDSDANLDDLTIRIDDDDDMTVGLDETGASFSVLAPASGRIIYRAVGAGEESNQAAIRVEVVPDGENRDPVAVRDDVTVTVGLRSELNAVDVLLNDFDPDYDPLAATPIPTSIPRSIRVANAGNGRFEIEVVDATAKSASFRYQLDDGNGGTSVTSVVVKIKPPQPNRPPIAVDDAETARAGTTATIDVLDNDSDPEGTAVIISVVDSDAPDWITIGDTLIANVPEDAQAGNLLFRYTIVDEQGLPAEAAVKLTILPADSPNRVPIAADDAAATPWNVAVVVDPLGNDDDPDGDPIFVGSAGGASHGAVEVINGTYIRYTPLPGIDTERADSFTYSISDGELSAEALVTVQLTRPPIQNQRPVARRDERRVTLGQATLIDVLANDEDPDQDPLSFVGEPSAPSSGSARIREGQIEFTPSSTGMATFTYTITDNRSGNATGTVQIEVVAGGALDPPNARDDETPIYRSGEQQSTDVLANDLYSGEISIEPGPGLALGPGQLVSFVVPPRTTRFTYTIVDSAGQRDSAVLTVRVQDNRAPVVSSLAIPIVVDVNSDSSTIQLDQLVADPEGASLEFAKSGADQLGVATFNGATVVFNAGSIAGVGGFGVTASDGLNEVSFRVVVQVRGATNEAPTVRSGSIAVIEGQAVVVDLSAFVSDPERSTDLRYSALSTGPVSIQLGGQSLLTVTAQVGAGGQAAAVSFEVADGALASVAGTISVTIDPAVLPTPTFGPDGPFVSDATPFTTPSLITNDNPQNAIVSAMVLSGGGSVSVSGSALVVSPPASGYGLVSAVYVVEDANGTSHTSPPISVTFRSRPGPVTIGVTGNLIDLRNYDPRGGQFNRWILQVDGAAPFDHVSPTYAVPGAPGTTQRVRAQVVTDGGTSDWGVEVQVTQPPQSPDPPILAIVNGVNQFTVEWSTPNANGSTITDYVLYIDGAPQPSFGVGGLGPYSRSVSRVGGVTYQVAIASVSALGEVQSTVQQASPTFPPNRPPAVQSGLVFAFNTNSGAQAIDSGYPAGTGPLLPDRCCNVGSLVSDPDGDPISAVTCEVAATATDCAQIDALNLIDGSYTVTLRATDSLGAVGTGSFTLNVANLPSVGPPFTCVVTGDTPGLNPFSGLPSRNLTYTFTMTLPAFFWPIRTDPARTGAIWLDDGEPSAFTTVNTGYTTADVAGRIAETVGSPDTTPVVVTSVSTVGSSCLE